MLASPSIYALDITDHTQPEGFSALSSLGPVLGAGKDGTASAETSRGLLITILGELVLPRATGAWTQTLVELMGLLGVRDKSARQSIARLHDGGWLERERVGRQVRWTLSDRSTALLEAGAHRIYGFGQHVEPWDNRWLVVLASVPESDRTIRGRLRVGLNWGGFGSIAAGVWASPWLHQEQAIVKLCRDLDIEATTFHAELGELGDGAALVATGWDLPAIRSMYDEFLTTFPENHAVSDDETAAGDLVRLVHHWRRFPFSDPQLPAQLLPDDWPGRKAAERFAQLRSSLSPAAHEWWQTTERHHAPG